MTSTALRLALEFDTEAELREAYERELRHGAATAETSSRPEPGRSCELVLLHPRTGHMLSLRATVTGQSPDGRTSLRLEGLGPETDARLRQFLDIHAARGAPAPAAPPPPAPELGEPAPAPEPGEPEGLEDLSDAAAEQGGGLEDGDDPLLLRTKLPAHVFQRLRGLPTHEVYKLARSGQIAERVALERIYGKVVWEPLLQNPNLTAPEVARIAKMGTLPKPLIDAIVAHAGWLTKPIVRRALLANPRLEGRALAKVLRALPKNELKAVPAQTAYPYRVREAARRLVGE